MTLAQRISKLEGRSSAVNVKQDRDEEALPIILPILDMHPDAKASVLRAIEQAMEQDPSVIDKEALPFILTVLDKYPDVKGEVLEALEQAKQ
jgi:hypothetical protein